jgi:DNA invertase Pin-like site-specific DNA recombinase|tara:strand:- start:490 stop:1089 length:600 start_codon:yes stop_codon:yes gene_type:complete
MEQMMTKRVAIYARVSTKDQDCDRQLVELREVAENHNWVIVDEYVDTGISGAQKSRPELDRMLKDAISRKFEMVATLELSRLGRSVSNMCEIVDLLKSKNIHLFIKNQNVDTTTIVGDFFFNIMNCVAQYERDLIRERIMSGLENAKRKGVKLGRPGISQDMKDDIQTLRKTGLSFNKIAQQVGISKSVVVRTIHAQQI